MRFFSLGKLSTFKLSDTKFRCSLAGAAQWEKVIYGSVLDYVRRFLTDRKDFKNTPKYLGSINYFGRDEDVITIAVMQQLVETLFEFAFVEGQGGRDANHHPVPVAPQPSPVRAGRCPGAAGL